MHSHTPLVGWRSTIRYVHPQLTHDMRFAHSHISISLLRKTRATERGWCARLRVAWHHVPTLYHTDKGKKIETASEQENEHTKTNESNEYSSRRKSKRSRPPRVQQRPAEKKIARNWYHENTLFVMKIRNAFR